MTLRVPALVALLLLATSACTTPRPVRPALAVERMLPLGSVRVDSGARTVMATGFVNLVEGPIELVICGPGGKRHESVFVMEADPVDLQAALLLVGAQAGPPMEELGVGPPHGSLVDIWVEWPGAGGAPRSEPAERFAWFNRERRALEPRGWVFTGSMFVEGKFKALAEESLATSYWDPWSILNINDPVGADDECLTVNTNLVPELGQPVTFYLQARP